MKHFYPIRIQEIRKEADHSYEITFSIPEEQKELFAFHQGQYLTFRATIDGKEERRNYSVCSAPYEKEIRVGIKHIKDGKFSGWVHQNWKPGMVIDTMPPDGRFFTPLDPHQKKQYVLFAGGIGITPILSILKEVLHTEPLSHVTLVYACKDKKSVIFKQEIEGLKNKYHDRFRIFFFLSKEFHEIPLYQGRIDTEKCKILFDKMIPIPQIDEVFLCGPQGLIETVQQYLEAQGFPKKQIHQELFVTPDQGPKTAGNTTVQAVEATSHQLSKVTVCIDGRSLEFELGYQGDTVLEAALNQGVDLPYSCKGGVCCTCKAIIKKGTVTMEKNYALEEDEVKAGYILTCQSHPSSPELVIDYDV